jgi:HK97 family phage major capsid protein
MSEENKVLENTVEQAEKAINTVAELEKGFSEVKESNMQVAKDVLELRSFMEAKHGQSGADDFDNEMAKFVSGAFKHSRGDKAVADFTTTTDATAGYLVDDILSNELFEIGDVYGTILPRCTNLTVPAGTTMKINKDATLPTAYWRAAQGAAMTEAEATLGQASLSPILVGAYIKAANELLESPGVGFGSLMAVRMSRAILKAKEDAILKGASSGSEPSDGLTVVTGVNDQTAIDELDFAGLVAFLGEAAADYAPSADPLQNALFIDPVKYLAFMGHATAATMPGFTWADPANSQPASVFGYEMIVHPSMYDGTDYYLGLGDPANIVTASSGEVRVDFNPYSGWTSNETWMRVFTHFDYEVMIPSQWSKATLDSA